MELKEYEKVKNFTYQEYCNYLQDKYGIGKTNYFYKGCNSKNKNCTRTKEGLIVHHKYEDQAILLSNPDKAKLHPFEWQLAENLVYCDYLEHLLLHIKICKHSKEDMVGIGGISEIVPLLNDFYSGFEIKQEYLINLFNKVKKDKEVYLELLKAVNKLRYPKDFLEYIIFSTSEYNALTGWSVENNKKLFQEIKQIL